jgi:formylglycine-generating enzyme required for sulfatase activity
MKAIRERDYTPLKDRRELPAPVLAVVEKCLAHRPEDRYQSAKELIDAVESCLSGPTTIAATPEPAEDGTTEDETRLVKLKAYQLAEDAKRNGCDKLSNQQLSEGVELFRNGEAYEQLKQYGAAKKSFEEARTKFTEAIDRAKIIMSKMLALKAARAQMEDVRKKAETARANELAREVFDQAVAREEEARATSGVIKATQSYQQATALYVSALKAAMKHGEAVLVEIRNQLDQLEQLLEKEGLTPFLEMEVRHVVELRKEARAALPDFEKAKTHYQAAIAHYKEALPKGKQRKEYAAERESRDPITIAGIELIWVPPGHFYMGSDDGSVEEEPRHEVTIPHGFWMGKYPVTQGQWEAIMGNNPSGFSGSPDLPVENVSWDDCKAFIGRLNKLGEGLFRLPTEAEWEYACRADSTGDWCFGNDESQLGDYAWGHENAEGRTHPVGEKKPNAWQFHDMHGNVCEWCEDHRHQDYTGAPNRGQAWLDENVEERMTRGGSWCIITPECRSAYRGWYASPSTKSDFMGFRVCRSA